MWLCDAALLPCIIHFFFYGFPETNTQNNKIMLPNDIFYVLCTMCVFDLTTFCSFLIAKNVYFC